MQRIKGIIQLLVAAALVGLIIWTNVIPDEGRRIEDSVYLDNAQVLPENEGKRVIIAGRLSTREGATDPDFGISFASPIVRRSVERLHYREGWEWVGISEGSTGYALTDNTFAGTASIGQFDLEPALLRTLPGGERDWEEGDLDVSTIDRLRQNWYFNYDGGQLYLSQISAFAMNWEWPLYAELEGSLRVRYRVWNSADDLEVTVVGIQRGSTLCYDPDLNASPAYEGILGADELVKTNGLYTLLGELICAVIPVALLLFFGIRNVREL